MPHPGLLPLFPLPGPAREVEGLYLGLRLHEQGGPGSPFVFASFVSSLDGRIASSDAADGGWTPLAGLASRYDFRLLQELLAQADCLVTHGGYLRALAAGHLGNVLQVNANGAASDLAAWRATNGLAPQPAIAIASASLDFVLPTSPREHGQKVYVATVPGADRARMQVLAEAGAELLVLGRDARVPGGALADALGARGHRALYLLAGPMMLEAMLRDGRLDRLFLTLRHRLLGGEAFQTMIHGPRLGAAGDLELRALYHDPGERGEVSQWFAELAPVGRR
jgi:riboflavin biosynthesis pyrimidine reductase